MHCQTDQIDVYRRRPDDDDTRDSVLRLAEHELPVGTDDVLQEPRGLLGTFLAYVTKSQ